MLMDGVQCRKPPTCSSSSSEDTRVKDLVNMLSLCTSHYTPDILSMQIKPPIFRPDTSALSFLTFQIKFIFFP
jgi:hypothetical protein